MAVQMLMSIRTWAFVDGDAAAFMPNWAIPWTGASVDAYVITPRLTREAGFHAGGTTLFPHSTAIALCQHSHTSYKRSR